MTTLDQLVIQVRQHLLGFTQGQESQAELAAPVGPSDTAFAVTPDTADRVSRGLVEIGDELILVRSADELSGAVSVLGGLRGRGAQGTVPGSYTTGELVTSAPLAPRARIKEALNQAVEALYPDLVVYAVTDFPYVSAQVEYPLPADADQVWYVTARRVGPEKISGPLPNWRYNPRALTADFPTGRSIQIFDSVTSGQNVRVVYAKAPAPLSAGTDDFTATGYPDRYHELVVWDACKRLLPGLLTARLGLQAVEGTERAQLVSARDIASAVQTFAALHGEALQRERNRQFDELPNYATFQGS